MTNGGSRDESEALRAQIEKLEKIIGMIGNVFYDDVMRRNGTRPVDLGLAKVIDLPRDSRGHLDREFFGSDFELDNLWRFDG